MINKKLRKEDMVAGPYNPDRSLSFGDMIVAELELMLQKGRLSPVVYNKSVDLARRIQGPLTSIYSSKRHGLTTAVNFIINKCR